MQLGSTSNHATEIRQRDVVRAELAEHVAKFLENNNITVLNTAAKQTAERATAFNRIITANPSKQRIVTDDREKTELTVRELASIDIEGVRIKRSVHEVAKIMRERGYTLRALSVQRIAQNIGVELAT